MDSGNVLDVVRNLDQRLDRIEQFLPSVATKAELQDTAAKLSAELATKAELQATAAKLSAELATKDQLREAVAKLATKDELREAVANLATKDELREEGERSRRYSLILYESLRDDIRIIADGLAAATLEARTARLAFESRFENHEIRLLRLESENRPRG